MSSFSKPEKYAILILAIGIFAGGIIFLFTKAKKQDTIKINTENITLENKETKEREIFVHITGAVAKPGVYKVKEGTRLNDVVSLAHPYPYADVGQLNLASKLQDGQKIVVPEKNLSSPSFHSQPSKSSNLVNINTAEISELVNLPGIGPATAKKIIDYRTSQGPFTSPEDVKNVPGIGDKKFEKFKHLITVY